jgi:myo-inositol 2-dehydrogenase/D-chiro-inositol 1-dehydrogenase
MKRRKFISGTMKVAAGTVILPTIVPSSVIGKNPPGDKINIGWIGNGRQGRGDIMGTMRFDSAMVVAVSDVDSNRMALGKKMVEDYYTRKTGWPTKALMP